MAWSCCSTIPCPAPTRRRARCAWRSRCARASPSSPKSWRKQGHELGFGVGIAQGYATLGRIGFEGRFDYAAIGPVANLASRLCDEAGDGEILISQRALAAVEDLVEAEPVGDLALKGFTRPVHGVSDPAPAGAAERGQRNEPASGAWPEFGKQGSLCGIDRPVAARPVS